VASRRRAPPATPRPLVIGAAGTRERGMDPRRRGGRDAASASALTKQSLDTACVTEDF
jgi:hypothetical protein